MEHNDVIKTIIKIYKDKKRLKFVGKSDLYNFVKENFDNTVYASMLKSQLEDVAYRNLNSGTLDLFCDKLDKFGISQGDASECLNITDKSLKKLIDNGMIRIRGYYQGSMNRHIVYSIVDVKDVIKVSSDVQPKKIKKDEEVLPCTPLNLAESLYIINKSAKTSRDTKVASYDRRKHRVCHAAKTRSQNLYHLKDAVLKRMVNDGLAEYVGVNRQLANGRDSFLDLYEVAGFTFHMPHYGEINEEEMVGVIEGTISAEKSRKTSITFTQAVKLLENYSGVKATGTYNKKYE